MVHGAFFSDTGTRAENEDSVCLREDGGKLAAVVADGLGGQGGGRQAADMAVDALGGFLPTEDWEKVLHERFNKANRNILMAQRPGVNMMTTAVCLYLDGSTAMWAHIGDSRLYHFLNGRLVEQTFDHSVSQMAVYRKEITQEQIRFHEDRNRVLRALGGDEEAREERRSERLEAGAHAFLLCSDGFWEYILEEQMEETLVSSATPEEWLVKMCNQSVPALKITERDNFTAAAAFYVREERE